MLFLKTYETNNSLISNSLNFVKILVILQNIYTLLITEIIEIINWFLIFIVIFNYSTNLL